MISTVTYCLIATYFVLKVAELVIDLIWRLRTAVPPKGENAKAQLNPGWHFGRVTQFERTENKTIIVFEDGCRICLGFKYNTEYKKGDFVRFYYDCKKIGENQTALNDFIPN